MRLGQALFLWRPAPAAIRILSAVLVHARAITRGDSRQLYLQSRHMHAHKPLLSRDGNVPPSHFNAYIFMCRKKTLSAMTSFVDSFEPCSPPLRIWLYCTRGTLRPGLITPGPRLFWYPLHVRSICQYYCKCGALWPRLSLY